MSEWVLREATPDDADALAALVREAFEEYRDRLRPPSGAHNETGDGLRARRKIALVTCGTTIGTRR